MSALLRYDAACRAIAEAKAVDEVKDIRDKAEALRHYARQAKNRQAEIDMAEVRFRAELRIGEIKAELRATDQLHEGGRPKKTSAEKEEVSKVRLSDYGIDDKLSARADAYQATGNSFDRLVARWRDYQEKSTGRVSLDLLKEHRDEQRRADNAIRVQDGCTVDDLYRLIEQGRTFATILADPPWKFIARSEKGEGRSAVQHYRTDVLAAIKALPVAQLAADDAVLLMWMVDWCPTWALEVIEAWGFAHKTTAFTWAKQTADGKGWHMGQGYWTRANPEDCWLATRGNPRRLNADVRQLVVHPVMQHSRKPDEVHDLIERLVPGPYLELYARRERRGWVTWGNEIARAAFEAPADAAGEAIDHDPDTGEVIEPPDPQPTNEKGERCCDECAPQPGPDASLTAGAAGRTAGDDDGLDIPALLRRRPDNTFVKGEP